MLMYVLTPDETWRTEMTEWQKYSAAAHALNCKFTHIHYLLGKSQKGREDIFPEASIDKQGLSERDDLLLYYLSHVKEDSGYEVKKAPITSEYPGFLSDTLKKFHWHVEKGEDTFRRLGEGLHVALYFAKVLMKQTMESKKLKNKVRIVVSAQYSSFRDSVWKVEGYNMIEGNSICFYISPEPSGREIKWKVQLWAARREWRGLTRMDSVAYRVSQDVAREYCQEACLYLAASDSSMYRKRQSKINQGKVLDNVINSTFRNREA